MFEKKKQHVSTLCELSRTTVKIETTLQLFKDQSEWLRDFYRINLNYLQCFVVVVNNCAPRVV